MKHHDPRQSLLKTREYSSHMQSMILRHPQISAPEILSGDHRRPKISSKPPLGTQPTEFHTLRSTRVCSHPQLASLPKPRVLLSSVLSIPLASHKQYLLLLSSQCSGNDIGPTDRTSIDVGRRHRRTQDKRNLPLDSHAQERTSAR